MGHSIQGLHPHYPREEEWQGRRIVRIRHALHEPEPVMVLAEPCHRGIHTAPQQSWLWVSEDLRWLGPDTYWFTDNLLISGWYGQMNYSLSSRYKNLTNSAGTAYLNNNAIQSEPVPRQPVLWCQPCHEARHWAGLHQDEIRKLW